MTLSLLQDLQERRLVQQSSNPEELERHLTDHNRTLYCGFDPTADSLHVGHLLPLLTLRRFQQQGHKPIILIGGATGLIGDPSGKDQERTLNERVITEDWAEKLTQQTKQYLDFDDSQTSARVVNNLAWAGNLRLLDFLRDTAKFFSVNSMIQKESVRSRIERDETGISFTEFSYMLLQSLDYLELASRHDCTLQIGGSDQWGNITMGMELVRKKLGRKVHALTLPLVTKANGDKFGKTASGETLWLDAGRTSPYQFYQFWINLPDENLETMLGYFTFLDDQARRELLQAYMENPEERAGQRRLAEEVTELVHGKVMLEAAQRITEALFLGTSEMLSEADVAQLTHAGLPCLKLESTEMRLRTALTQMGLIRNTSVFKDAVAKGSVKVNDKPVKDFDLRFQNIMPAYGRYFLVRFGKRKWGIVYQD